MCVLPFEGLIGCRLIRPDDEHGGRRAKNYFLADAADPPLTHPAASMTAKNDKLYPPIEGKFSDRFRDQPFQDASLDRASPQVVIDRVG